MTINRNSWHYLLQRSYFTDEAVSLCSYFWRMLVSTLFLFPFDMLLCYGFYYPFFNTGIMPINAIFHIHPIAPFPSQYYDKVDVGYGGFRRWRPRFFLFSIRGVEFVPANFVWLALIVWVIWASYTVRIVIAVVVGAIAMIWCFVLVGCSIVRVRDSEIWSLTKEWLKAKKDGVCPLIEYTGEVPSKKKKETSETDI